MGASNPQGQEQFWYDGQPWVWLQNGSHDAGTEQFWYDGRPAIGLLPPAAATPWKYYLGRDARIIGAGGVL